MCALSLPLSASLSLFYPGDYFCDVCGGVRLGPNGITYPCLLCVAPGPGSSLGHIRWDSLGQHLLVWAKTVPGTMVANKVLPAPCRSLVPRTGMGKRPARVGRFLDCFLGLQVTGLPHFLIVSNTTESCLFWGVRSLLCPPSPHSGFTAAQWGCAELVIAPANLHVSSLSLGTSLWPLFHLH